MRVALIGLGNAGTDLHLPALAGIPSATAVAACDPDAARREKAAARWRVPVFADPDAMFGSVQPEAVIVATPPAMHAEHCLRAIAAGAHVLCEKPFVSSVDEADRVLAAATAAGRRVAVNHEFREMPIFRALLEHVHGDNVGALQFVQAWQLMDMAPWSEAGWRGAILHRTLFEAGVHVIDLLMALYGETPVSVQASTSSGSSGRPEDAVVVATLEFSRGRLANVVQNRLCKGEPQYFEVRADTEVAACRASFGGRARVSAGLFRSRRPHLRFDYGSSGVLWREDGVRRTPLARNPGNPNMLATRAVIEDALESFRTGHPPLSSAPHARNVLQVIAACYLSALTGSRVRLEEARASELGRFRMGVAGGDVSTC
jgi:predicted dehydrogenase